MRNYVKEISVLLIQLFMFYIFPMFAGPTDAMGMVVVIIFTTFLLSLILGSFSKESIKYLYPLLIAMIFVPSVYIHYNESALVHTLWYLVISSIGLGIGSIIRKLCIKVPKR